MSISSIRAQRVDAYASDVNSNNTILNNKQKIMISKDQRKNPLSLKSLIFQISTKSSLS